MTGDGGMGITTDHGKSWNRVSLPIGQMYHVAIDNQVPYFIYANMQDDGTMRGPSDTPEPMPGSGGGRFGRRGGSGLDWQHGLGGCESGFTIPVPSNPDIVWSSCYGNKLTRFDNRRGTARSVSPWMISLDSPPQDARYRCHWTAPLAMDPFDPETAYYGCQVIFASSNGGQSWKVISPDLSTQDPKYIMSSGGIVGDNLGQFYGEVVFSIAPSPAQKGLIWAGTNDGKVWYTRNGGTNWNDVTKNIPGMPAWSTVSKIDPSPFDAATAYIAVDAHLMDDSKPYIFKTADFGKTWTKITGDIPTGHPLDYVRAIAENPNRRGMLFAGTGHGFYYSMDDGAHWTQLQNGLPTAPVTWVVVQKRQHDVVVSTYGRGLYILDDITPLEQAGATTTTTAKLFEPRPGTRLARNGTMQFTYALPSAGDVKVEILDEAGTVVRTMDKKGKQGLNRATWDLRYEEPRYVVLRTTPAENPHIWDEPRFEGKDTRSVTHWGLAQAQVGPLAAPGKYTVRLTAAGQTFTQPFEVIKDPKITSSEADLKASVATQVRIRDDINTTSDMINDLESLRKQIEDQSKSANSDALAALKAMDKKMQDVEYQLISRANTLSDDKYFQEAYKAYSNLIWLFGAVSTGAGDEAGGADYRPTDQQLEVLAVIEKNLAAAKADYTRLMQTDVPAFNRDAASKGLTPLTPVSKTSTQM
jgi:hypothetical protein